MIELNSKTPTCPWMLDSLEGALIGGGEGFDSMVAERHLSACIECKDRLRMFENFFSWIRRRFADPRRDEKKQPEDHFRLRRFAEDAD